MDARTPTQATTAAETPRPGGTAPRGAGPTEILRRRAASLVLGKPWFDGAGLALLRALFFPLSRLWAAAHLAGGNPRRFDPTGEGAPSSRDPGRVARALELFEAQHATSAALDAAWHEVMFGPGDYPLAYRDAIEVARLRHRHAFNATRRHFWPFVDRTVPAVRLAPQAPDAVAAVYATACDNLGPFTAPPDPMPPVAISRAVTGRAGTDVWLRFASPSPRLGDVVTARVYAPPGVENPPTVILGHGVCVEFDHWQGLVDEVDVLVRGGVRVIRPEAPWHGRRAPPGYFGGERLIATFPLGLIDALLGAVREWSVLAHWARATSSGPLAFGGTSLGALTAQLAADRARDWPEPLRPEALFLMTHCGVVADAVTDGALARLWGGPEAVAAAGWSEATLLPYLALLDPLRRPVVPPHRIVSVLGRRDVVTPYAGGRDILEHWCVPADNTFLLDRGHFSVPMTLLTDDRPARRFIDIMRGIAHRGGGSAAQERTP